MDSAKLKDSKVGQTSQQGFKRKDHAKWSKKAAIKRSHYTCSPVCLVEKVWCFGVESGLFVPFPAIESPCCGLCPKQGGASYSMTIFCPKK
ncbi:hypothetical protein CEXT_690091 [Caerostris extrusa]|uniref:Uncharacterized protein n=1 Tax=Caerostris extrusa TaxID=172846 RepID=A0AAV4QF30_CAEEX|nr:hypothetical protein CEXT_690091 [Caerostris extrusa]